MICNLSTKNLKFSTKKRAYSLLEIIVSLLIVSIIIVMLTNILFLSLDISKKSFARTSIRESQSEILRKIEKDIRNAHFIEQCAGENENAMCIVELDKKYYWTTCQNEQGNMTICKKINLGTPNEQIVEELPNYIKVDLLSFEQDPGNNAEKRTIVVTTSFSHVQEEYSILNQIRQIIISTRNYSY